MVIFNKIEFDNLLKKEKVIDNLQTTIVHKFLAKNIKLSVAESCTGGLISKKITDISGSSGMYECGICTYSNDMKIKLLNVKEGTLIEHGAVSEQTALEMARGVLRVACSDISVVTTGIAGPLGGTTEKPVGLVYIAIATKYSTECFKIEPEENQELDRESIREFSSQVALYLVLKTAEKF